MTEVVRPYFGPKLGSKLVGHRLIFWVIVPTVLNGLFLVYLVLDCLCTKS